jgi:hypothetical protein
VLLLKESALSEDRGMAGSPMGDSKLRSYSGRYAR